MVESNVSHSASTTHRQFLIPKEIAEALIALGQHKAAHTPLWKTLIGSFYAGFYVAFGGMCAITAAGGLDPTYAAANPSVPKLIVGVTFWIALILIMTLGGELFTGNLMYCMLARLHGRCTTLQMLTNWLIVFWGNWGACAFCGYVLAYKGQLYIGSPWLKYLQNLALHKVELDWDVVVARAIGANWMVCCAVSLSLASQDQLSRTVSCFLPVFLFALVGFEHCIANQFYVSLALMYGCPTTLADFITSNLIPAVIGNFIGAFLCGAGFQLLFLYDSVSHDAKPPSLEERKAADDLKAVVAKNTVPNAPAAAIAEASIIASTFPSISFVKRFMRRSGEVISLAVHTTIILNSAGVPERIFSTLKSVTDASSQEGCLSAIWNGEEDIEDKAIVLVDSALCHILGFSREELLSKTLKQITYVDDAHLSTRLFKQVLSASSASGGVCDKPSISSPLAAGASDVTTDVEAPELLRPVMAI